MDDMPSDTLQMTQTYFTIDCPRHGCGVVFAISSEYLDRRRKDHRALYCPNGHGMSYSGPTELEKKAQRLEKQLARREEELTREMARVVDERKAHAATKGQLTKTRNRAAKAMCPVDGCRRHFANVARHVANQHPDFDVQHLAR
jgi:hypothetical protein